MSTQLNCENQFYFKLFSLFKQLSIIIQLSVSTVSMSKCILQPQPTRQYTDLNVKQFYFR